MQTIKHKGLRLALGLAALAVSGAVSAQVNVKSSDYFAGDIAKCAGPIALKISMKDREAACSFAYTMGRIRNDHNAALAGAVGLGEIHYTKGRFADAVYYYGEAMKHQPQPDQSVRIQMLSARAVAQAQPRELAAMYLAECREQAAQLQDASLSNLAQAYMREAGLVAAVLPEAE